MTISPSIGYAYGNTRPISQWEQDYNAINLQLANNSVFARENCPGVYTPQPAAVPPGQQVPAQPEDENAGFFGGIWQATIAPLKGGWEVIKSGGKFIGNVAGGAWRATGGALGKLFTGHPFEAVSEFANGILDIAKAPFELGSDLLSDVGNFISDVADGVGDALGSLLPWNW
ncbi:MAG: hypothetical protein K6E29_01795 [Cyanobacteria bacterium RUI128]|nr:hypothetical protein [Cyanobacteria bacterium RUI128]